MELEKLIVNVKITASCQTNKLVIVSYLHKSCPRSYASDGEIWRPLPNEGYRPEKVWAAMG